MNMETLEKERDFYFGKLRDIEQYLQANSEAGLSEMDENILKILYASEEEKVAIGDNGQLMISGGATDENQDMTEEHEMLDQQVDGGLDEEEKLNA